MNYEQDLYIDDSSLDVEWLEQASLMMKYSTENARTRLERDRLKQNIEVVKAEIDKEIRSDPESFGIIKITEAAIQAAILTNTDYKEAHEEYLKACYEADITQSAVRAVEQRKDALENLVRLHGMQYFAGPKVPRNLTEEREMRQKKTDTGVAKKLMSRRQAP